MEKNLQIGDKVIAPEGVRQIVEFLKNKDKKDIIRWTGPNSSGVCMPDLWTEWTQGEFIDEKGNPSDNRVRPKK